jgi:hypothetical protein
MRIKHIINEAKLKQHSSVTFISLSQLEIEELEDCGWDVKFINGKYIINI